MLCLVIAAAAAAQAIHLTDLLTEADRANPALRAAEEQAAAAATDASASAALDDPMLMLQLWNAPADFSTVPVMGQLSQTIPLGGKLSARRAGGRAGAEAARADLESMRRDVRAEVEKAWAELFLAERTAEVDAEIEKTETQMIDAANARVAAGKGTEVDVLRSQADRLSVLSDAEMAGAKRLSARARLAASVGRDNADGFGTTLMPSLVASLTPLEELTTRGLKERPELAGSQAMLEQARAQARAAGAERVPDLSVSLGEMHTFRQESGESEFLFGGLSANLPVWGGKTRAHRRAALERAAALELSRRALEQRVRSEVAAAYAMVTAEQVQIDLHHRLIPVSRQALEVSLAAYGAGRVDFTTVIDTRRELTMHELDLASHLAAYETSLADLERAVGVDLGLAAAADIPNPEHHDGEHP